MCLTPCKVLAVETQRSHLIKLLNGHAIDRFARTTCCVAWNTAYESRKRDSVLEGTLAQEWHGQPSVVRSSRPEESAEQRTALHSQAELAFSSSSTAAATQHEIQSMDLEIMGYEEQNTEWISWGHNLAFRF